MINLSEKSRTFITYHGLKVRLNHDFCCKQMDNMNIHPWYISIEAFDSLRNVLSIITATVMILLQNNSVYSGIVILCFYLIGYYISQSYFFMILLNMIYGSFYMLYSVLERFFIPYILLIVIGVLTKELDILISFIVARLICFFILRVVNIIKAKYYIRKFKVYLGDVEVTAAKLILIYSDKKLRFNQFMIAYSKFLNKE